MAENRLQREVILCQRTDGKNGHCLGWIRFRCGLILHDKFSCTVVRELRFVKNYSWCTPVAAGKIYQHHQYVGVHGARQGQENLSDRTSAPVRWCGNCALLRTIHGARQWPRVRSTSTTSTWVSMVHGKDRRTC